MQETNLSFPAHFGFFHSFPSPWEAMRAPFAPFFGLHTLLISLVLDVEGSMWQAGSLRSSASPLPFERAPEVPPMALLAAGMYHSAALDTKGGLWVWTCEGNLPGAGSLPQRVEGLHSSRWLVTGTSSWQRPKKASGCCATTHYGQLGLVHTQRALQPTLVQLEERSEGPLRCLAALYQGVMIVARKEASSRLETTNIANWG